MENNAIVWARYSPYLTGTPRDASSGAFLFPIKNEVAGVAGSDPYHLLGGERTHSTTLPYGCQAFS